MTPKEVFFRQTLPSIVYALIMLVSLLVMVSNAPPRIKRMRNVLGFLLFILISKFLLEIWNLFDGITWWGIVNSALYILAIIVYIWLLRKFNKMIAEQKAKLP